jgi:transposase-like protein
MERLMREVKRRTDFVGIFPSGSFCDRFVGAQLLERHESWQCETIRCLVMDHIAQTPPKQPGPHDAENH